jgi:exodeoxyribonuclease VII large subunit
VERALGRRIGRLEVRVSGVAQHLETRSPSARLRHMHDQVDRAVEDPHAAVRQHLRVGEDDVDGAVEHLHVRSPRRAIDQAARDLARQGEQIREAMRSRLEELARRAAVSTEDLHESAVARVSDLEQELAAAAEGLDARSPFRVLARGYAVVSDAATGQVVRSPAEVVAEQRLRVRLAGGEITVRAEEGASAAESST